MSYGAATEGTHPWTLGEDEARPFIRKAVEAGINFFDTANAYSGGTSEQILGRALHEYAPRDDVVIATKLYMRMRHGPNARGLSRKAIFTEVEASLRRLGTDYIDLYQIHRWDYGTPIEETLEALHDVVKAGKVRYLGASSMYAWQFAKALYTADLHGWTRFVSMQNPCARTRASASSRGVRSRGAGSLAVGTTPAPAQTPTTSARHCTAPTTARSSMRSAPSPRHGESAARVSLSRGC